MWKTLFLAQKMGKMLGGGAVLQPEVQVCKKIQIFRGPDKITLMATLRLILGDQLNLRHSWFSELDDEVWYCLFEMRQETDYVWHHVQKVIGFFAAMRDFAETLTADGHQVIYFQLDDSRNRQTLEENLSLLIEEQKIDRFEYLLPDEYRLDQQLQAFCSQLFISFQSFDTEHFLSTRTELSEFFEGKKTFLMETFYRHMRRKHNILMDNEDPVGGQWNYDAENRKKMPKDHDPPVPKTFDRDVSDLYALIKEQEIKTIGEVDKTAFLWPVNRAESLELVEYFIENCLIHFGDFQDAMSPDHWAMYHARLSFSLNTKMISPLELVQKAVDYWSDHQTEIEIAQIEGFVRQIIGWREYMRGIYWAKMPQYASLNFFEHDQKLPSWYWTGDTKMLCLQHAITQSLQYAYAHHIQRLMITGNFALLSGIDPDQVDRWYLGIYIDAIQWVEITNTRGMSQFADGGIVGTKPYVSSANYIDKMSHYCKSCHYDKKQKTGERACPFNSLYWNFYDRHREKLSGNARISMMYRVWERMDSDQREAILKQAQQYLQDIESL